MQNIHTKHVYWTEEKGRLACEFAILAKLDQKQLRMLDAKAHERPGTSVKNICSALCYDQCITHGSFCLSSSSVQAMQPAFDTMHILCCRFIHSCKADLKCTKHVVACIPA